MIEWWWLLLALYVGVNLGAGFVLIAQEGWSRGLGWLLFWPIFLLGWLAD